MCREHTPSERSAVMWSGWSGRVRLAPSCDDPRWGGRTQGHSERRAPPTACRPWYTAKGRSDTARGAQRRILVGTPGVSLAILGPLADFDGGSLVFCARKGNVPFLPLPLASGETGGRPLAGEKSVSAAGWQADGLPLAVAPDRRPRGVAVSQRGAVLAHCAGSNFSSGLSLSSTRCLSKQD